METGEGKSITFAVIAAFHALQGKRVDVATSSSQLARDGERSAAPLFDAFELSHGVCDHRELAKNGDSTPRNLFVSELVNVATAFIRGKLERRTAEFSNRMAAYGLGKLVDLRSKAKRLLSK
ncbi:hypothetical protein BBJ28_00025604 [Nothophytophthora sp. Chile5]|nr:hypothetical protein BBJ28_00025604 [Nothophytophthora sp. Chile5]